MAVHLSVLLLCSSGMALDLIFDVLLKSHPAVNTPIKETIQESSQEPVEGSEEKAGAKRRKASVPKVSD